jgi:predicted transcriptional regulator
MRAFTQLEESNLPETDRLALIANVTASYLRRNATSPDQIATVVANITRALDDAAKLSTPTPVSQVAADQSQSLQPAVPVKRSVQRAYIVCLEDGIHARTLKKHLAVAHGMTPDQYRAKWGLSDDYPMVAPEYSEQRSAMAKSIGLGRKPVRGGKQKAAPAKRRKRG